MQPRDLSADLMRALRHLKLGRLVTTLPERLRQARERGMDPEDVLLVVLNDEVQRRDRQRIALRAAKAGLDSTLVFDAWDVGASVKYDRGLFDELRTVRFVEQNHHVLLLGPVGVGKTMIAHAIGNQAIVNDLTVWCESADRLFKRLKGSRLDDTHAAEMRRLCHVDVLIIDDLGLRALDAMETADFYDIVAERHRKASMIITSNREPSEWLAILGDPLHAQATVDRLVNNSHELVIEGESYRKRQKPLRAA